LAGPSSDPLAHLFRHEAGRMVAALTRLFGLHNLALAEDVVQDALCRALEVWKFSGVPDNPSAWLMAAARNRAVDILRRERTARTYAPELEHVLSSEAAIASTVSRLFLEPELRDEQLRLMFSCCHSRIAEETQVALILNILCGFSAREVASAFLVPEATLEKRLQRGKAVLAEAGSLPEVPSEARQRERLDAVLRALYLLFNEGYHGSHPAEAVRAELCAEALRLGSLLTEHQAPAAPAAYALLALMCLHAGRLPGRLNARGELLPFAQQDRSAWNLPLISQGLGLLARSATGEQVTPYHLEAGIAAEHAMAPSPEETDWARIIGLYDLLLELRPSPVVALNRAISIAQLEGPGRGLEELRRIDGQERLSTYPFYPAALGELYLRLGKAGEARECFQTALQIARNPVEARFFEQRIAACAEVKDSSAARPRGGSSGGPEA
jgi:RNA polymerase sigma-70 factor (ECF subfamily)